MNQDMATTYPCILLAAGAGSRMGGHSKLLLPLGEKMVLVRALERAAEFCKPLVVVTGRDDGALRSAMGSFDSTDKSLIIIHNANWQEGRVSSLLCGMDALKEEYGGFFIAHADMPCVDASVYLLLARTATARVASGLAPAVLFPSNDGHRGHPVFVPFCFAPRIRAVRSGESLKATMGTLPCIDVETPSLSIFEDLDTPGDYKTLCANYGFSLGDQAMKRQT